MTVEKKDGVETQKVEVVLFYVKSLKHVFVRLGI